MYDRIFYVCQARTHSATLCRGTQGLYEAKAAQLSSEADLLRASSDSTHHQIHAYEAIVGF